MHTVTFSMCTLINTLRIVCVDDENCTGLVTGTLSKFDLQREYKTDASEKFKSYIVDPQATTTKTDRYLKNRYL